eukprot:COSAG01_NODE_14411_length_1457_cov_0.663476_1_plen_318_part_01
MALAVGKGGQKAIDAKLQAEQAAATAALREAFDRIDTDRGGTLDQEEVRAIFAENNIEVSSAEVSAMMQRAISPAPGSPADGGGGWDGDVSSVGHLNDTPTSSRNPDDDDEEQPHNVTSSNGSGGGGGGGGGLKVAGFHEHHGHLVPDGELEITFEQFSSWVQSSNRLADELRTALGELNTLSEKLDNDQLGIEERADYNGWIYVFKGNLRCTVFVLLEESDSSRGAFYVSCAVMTVIAFSTVMFCLETVKRISDPHRTFFKAQEAVCIALFSVEYLLRAGSCTARPYSNKSALTYLLSPMNIVRRAIPSSPLPLPPP